MDHVPTLCGNPLVQKDLSHTESDTLKSQLHMYLDWLQSLKQFFINVSYHMLVASLTLMALFFLKYDVEAQASSCPPPGYARVHSDASPIIIAQPGIINEVQIVLIRPDRPRPEIRTYPNIQVQIIKLAIPWEKLFETHATKNMQISIASAQPDHRDAYSLPLYQYSIAKLILNLKIFDSLSGRADRLNLTRHKPKR